MTDLHCWLHDFPGARWAPLFATNGALEVQTHRRGRKLDRRILTRAPSFDATVIDLVEAGLQHPTWTGLLYLMAVGDPLKFTPLYIGKTERRGVVHEISQNIASIRRNPGKFARWGYGLDYHLGDLSHALFQFTAYRAPTPKYRRWAAALFETLDPPTLKAPVQVLWLPWHEGSRGPSGLNTSLAAAEKEVIALAGAMHGDQLLNVDGR